MIPVTIARIATIGIEGKGVLVPDAVVAEALIVGALIVGEGMSGGSCVIGAGDAVLPIVLYGTTLLSDAAKPNSLDAEIPPKWASTCH